MSYIINQNSCACVCLFFCFLIWRETQKIKFFKHIYLQLYKSSIHDWNKKHYEKVIQTRAEVQIYRTLDKANQAKFKCSWIPKISLSVLLGRKILLSWIWLHLQNNQIPSILFKFQKLKWGRENRVLEDPCKSLYVRGEQTRRLI